MEPVVLGPEEGAAIDHERLAGDETTGVRAEKERDRADVGFWISLPTDRMFLQELLVRLGVARRRLDAAPRCRTGSDRVDDDAVAAPLTCGRTRQGADRLLGSVLRAVPRHAG